MSEATEKKDQELEEVINQEEKQAEGVETIENDSIEGAEQGAQAELSVEEQYEAKIAELEAKLQEEENRFLRLRADFDNMRRRNQLDREASEKYRSQKLLTDLLPVIDNLERALEVEVTSEDAKSLYKGIEMVYRTLVDATNKEGLEAIVAEGEQFDPNVHQAVMQESDTEKESGIVLRELQKGYKLKDRVLRPSMVSVNE
ncbi:protein GrpE [Ureibacillus massiliensis 4400831 = CIP 108448 = CCUG 49529]|uniref:Protein GrpE n=1 Tax=Ureibacillus massiliensis 4400831 = CIP 108448 = CCUG 49529 TaxID=1211035 RepID=A0A0A3JUM1_9BACL|nr:nucleotide exchange factor GrpE [Ureibacillus massiliensis]KGR90707.1 protein GrpE [Ureibacillus massiliensis 4400831 = CIP 108448 = CCUG 49529]